MPKSFSFLSLASALVAASARLGSLESVTDFSPSPSALVPYPSESSSPLPLTYAFLGSEPSPSPLMFFNGMTPSPSPMRPEENIVCFDGINDPAWNGSARLPVVPVTVNIREGFREDIELMRDELTTAFDKSSLPDSYKLIPRCEAFDPYILQINFCDNQLWLRFATIESLNDKDVFSDLSVLACQLYKDYLAKKEHDHGVIVWGSLFGGGISIWLLAMCYVAIVQKIKTYKAQVFAAEEARNRLMPEAYAISAVRPHGSYGTPNALTVFGRRTGVTAPELPRAAYAGEEFNRRPLLSVNGCAARIVPPLNFGDDVDPELLRLAGISTDDAAAAPLVRNAARGYGTGGAV